MILEDIEVDKEYIMTHAYGQPSQKVKVLRKRENEIDVIYVSNDASKGRMQGLNRIECERYLH